MRSRRTIVVAIASLALVTAIVVTVAPAAVESAPAADGRGPNVLVKITLGKLEDGERKPLRTYQILAPGTGLPARLSTTNRIPLPAIAMNVDNDGNKVPTSSFTYQNVGFQANIRAYALSDHMVRINADIDDSALSNPSAVERRPGIQAPPVVTGFTQSFEAVVREGTPIVSTLIDDPKEQSLYIQIGAEVQK